MKTRIVSCPVCKKAVEWTPASRYRPFCSERCKTGDLGAWATGQYRVPGEQVIEVTGDEPRSDPT